MPLNKFYVYIHRRADDSTIFYIGKGKHRRAWNASNRSAWWKRTAIKHGFTVELVLQDMREEDAFQLEIDLIKFYDGHLVNMTGGGDGGIWLSEERRRKHSEQLAKRWKNDDYKQRLSEKAKQTWLDLELRNLRLENQKKALAITWVDPEFRAKRAENVRKHCSKKVRRGDGVVFNSTHDAAEKTGCHQGHISSVATGKRKSCGGYTWEYI